MAVCDVLPHEEDGKFDEIVSNKFIFVLNKRVNMHKNIEYFNDILKKEQSRNVVPNIENQVYIETRWNLCGNENNFSAENRDFGLTASESYATIFHIDHK